MSNVESIKTTNEWQLYERGTNFLRSRNYYDKVNKCIRFYQGDQWHGADFGDMPKVQYNFLKPIVKFKLGNLNTYEYSIIFNANNYESEEDEENMEQLCKELNSHIAVIWEQKKIDRATRKMKKNAAITGEGILYFYFKPKENKEKNKIETIENYTENSEDVENEKDNTLIKDIVEGEVDVEVLNTTDVCYGNENDDNIQNQPYIIIKRRRNLDDVIEEARANNISEDEINNIVTDKEVNEQAGDESKYEVNDAVLCVIKLYKKNGTVHCIQSTRSVVYQEDEDLGLKYYPIVHMTWDEDTGSARGIGEVEHNIPNQIETNKTLMRRAMIIRMIAYPKPVIDTEKIKNISAITKVGATVELKGAIDNINNHFGYIQPTQTSGEAVSLQNELISTTRELANASDTVTGSINPEKASGKAILAVQEAAQQPLNEQLYNFRDALEDCGLIILDIWRAYNVNGMNLYNKIDNNDLTQIETDTKYEIKRITNEQLEKLKPFIRIDITPKSSYDKFAQEQSIENLLAKGLITFEEYVEALDENSSMNKKVLMKIVQKRQEKQAEIQRMQDEAEKQKIQLENDMKTEQMANQVETDMDINDIQNRTAEQAQQMLGGMQ